MTPNHEKNYRKSSKLGNNQTKNDLKYAQRLYFRGISNYILRVQQYDAA